MSSINWVTLNPDGSPSPLPHEKFLLSTPSVALSLFPHAPGAPLSQAPLAKASEYRATGTTHVSNMRVVFVADGAGTASSLAAGSASVVRVAHAERAPLQSFSSPYSHFLDGRYVQPWFAATYYEALAMPAPGGGLESPHVVRLSFKESGGATFFSLVQEMKERIGVSGGRSAQVEPLPLYTPASPTSAPATLPLQPDDALPPPLATEDSPPLDQVMPPEDDLAAATVAQAAEEREASASASGAAPPEGPPAYQF